MPKLKDRARKATKQITQIEPHSLQELSARHPIQSEVSFDTETSGLYTDAGARVATASIAFEAPTEWNIAPGQHTWDGGILTHLPEQINQDGERRWLTSIAWPLDQGTDNTGKAEDSGALPLWGLTLNHGVQGWKTLAHWLTQHRLIMHHGKFDCHIANAGHRLEPDSGVKLIDQLYWDTQNVTSLIWGMHGTTALKPTCSRVFGQDAEDESKIVKDYLARNNLPTGRWDLVPWEVIARYADLDARLTYRLYTWQKHQLHNDPELADQIELVQRRLITTKMLWRMEHRGLPFDRNAALQASQELKQRAKKLELDLPFQPATLPMAKHYWFGTGVKSGVTGLGLTPEETTEKGAPKLDNTSLRAMVARGVEGARQWADYNKAQNADSRWYQGWSELAGPDGRLRGTVRQNGTRSGRFSIERVQLQAVPHDYRLSGFQTLDGLPTPRQLIGAGVPKGYTLWELDLANAELRVAARYAKCAHMLDLINQGQDLHGETAIQLFETDPEHPNWDQQRTIAKRANFSLIFGVGWAKLQNDIYTQTGTAMTDYQARELVYDWNGIYPEYKRAINRTMDVVAQRQTQYGYGWTKAANGERRWFTHDEDTHKGFNQRVQGNLAQFGIDWWLESDRVVDAELTEAGYADQLNQIGLVMLVHDSMVLLLPHQGDLDQRIVERVQQIGVRLWSEWFPTLPGGVDLKVWARGAD